MVKVDCLLSLGPIKNVTIVAEATIIANRIILILSSISNLVL